MPEAYIVDATRTPVGVGKPSGAFAAVHPADFGAHPIRELVGRGDFDPAAIDDVIYGCLDAIGTQAGNIARTSAMVAGLPQTVPGVTIDRQCGSSQQAVHFAAQAVMSGTADLIVAGGVQKMSQFPIGSSYTAGEPYGATNPVGRFTRLARTVRDQRSLPVRQCRTDCLRLGILQAGYGGVRADEPPTCGGSTTGRPLRSRDHAIRRVREDQGHDRTAPWKGWPG